MNKSQLVDSIAKKSGLTIKDSAAAVNAFLDSLPIMGVGLLGIFIVTIVLILGIYFLKAISSKLESGDKDEEEEKKADKADKVNKAESAEKADGKKGKKSNKKAKKESALDLMKERENTDFLEEEGHSYISKDL